MQDWASWFFLVVSIIIHFLFIVSLGTGLLNSFFYDTRYLVGQGADFFSYYQAGHNVLNGVDCYTIPDTLVVPYLYPYRYLPYFAFTFGVVFNLLPPMIAYWTWIGIVIAVLWSAVFQTRSLGNNLERSNWEVRIAMGMWLIFSPVYIELFVGQVTLVAGILMFFALTTSSFVEGGTERKGTMTTLWTTGSLTKMIPYFIAPVLLAAGRARAVLVAIVVTVCAIVLVPNGLELLQFFLGFNIARSTHISPYGGSHSLRMLILYLFGESYANSGILTGLLMGVFFMLAIGAAVYSRDVWASAGLFATTYFFIIVDVWEHHYTFILPLLVLFWIRSKPADKSHWVSFVILLLMSIPWLPIISFLSGSGPNIHPIIWTTEWQILYHSSKVVPALIFFVWLLVITFRTPRTENVANSILDVFQNIWNDLVKGTNPKVERGIIVENEKDTKKTDLEKNEESQK